MRNRDITANTTLVCQEDFIRYETIRADGRYNMRTEEARNLTGLGQSVYRAIIVNYEELASKWKQE